MGTEPRIRVSAILSWGGRILLCRHEKNGRAYWLLPGGGVNSGEGLVRALHSELAEEVGLDGESGFEGVRVGSAVGTYLHGPLLPRNPWLADWLLARALEHRDGEAPELGPLPDGLEQAAHVVSAERAKSRGGRF